MGLKGNLKKSSATVSSENDFCSLIMNFMEVFSEIDDVAKRFCEDLYKKANMDKDYNIIFELLVMKKVNKIIRDEETRMQVNMVIYNQFGVEECFTTSEWKIIERITAGLKIMQAIGNRPTEENIQLAKKIKLP